VLEKICPHCGRKFVFKRSHSPRYYYCGIRCRKAAHMNRVFDKAVHAMAQITSRSKFLTPEQLTSLRGEIAASASSHIKMAHEVLAGTRVWTPAQVAVFRSLINKVVPDLSASFVQKEVRTVDLQNLSISELEALVLHPPAAISHDPAQDLIDVTPQSNNSP
jgi:hypothetical protein